eukprot:scpid55069/ scgid1879/ Lanosterol synthase; 2,3-epoxysqualene--lanosterol cyclase; Oxidosqualene--lanosterol cyclase
MEVPRPATALEQWRLSCVEGRQVWRYVSQGEVADTPKQSFAERYFLGLTEASQKPAQSAELGEAIDKAMQFYSQLQSEDGHWAGDYGGPLFLMCGLIIVCYITRVDLGEPTKVEMIRYLRSVQLDDGGWGLHTAGKSTVFGTAMNYVSLRLLGVPRDDPSAVAARTRLHQLGGAVGIPSWGKFWLAVLNLYSWKGLHSLMPEIWLLPSWFPAHPSTLWCHCRQVYLPMAFCYGAPVTATATPLIMELRQELYVTKYDDIDWPSQRSNVAAGDLYTPHSWLLKGVHGLLNMYEWCHVSYLRKMALDLCYDHILFDDSATDGISIGPISKVIQMLVVYYREGPESDRFQRHVKRIPDYLWMGVDGMRMQGTNGSQLWDACFAVQAFLEAGAGQKRDLQDCLLRAHNFLETTQMRENPDKYETYYRHPNKGGFPFSTAECGWIVADCTAEGLKSLLLLSDKCGWLEHHCTIERLRDAVDSLLSFRNSDGGVATYETKRGGLLLELLNPSEVFGDIMIDYTYVECTSAVVQALHHFQERDHQYRSEEVLSTILRGFDYIRREQRFDGSWEGSWGVCFTYGAWFAMEALALDDETCSRSTSGSVPKGVEFLLSKRNADGGWGEDFSACESRQYAPCESSIVNTSWALLALMAAKYEDIDLLKAGVQVSTIKVSNEITVEQK